MEWHHDNERAKEEYREKHPLLMAAHEGEVDNVIALLKQGAASDMEELPQAVLFACEKGHADCLQPLLRARASPNAKLTDLGLTALHVSCSACSEQCVKILLATGASATAATAKDKLTPLHIACEYGERAIAEALLDRGAFVNAVG